MQACGWPVSLSAGVAVFTVAPEEASIALGIADALMYEAKADGKNRVRVRVIGAQERMAVGQEARGR